MIAYCELIEVDKRTDRLLLMADMRIAFGGDKDVFTSQFDGLSRSLTT